MIIIYSNLFIFRRENIRLVIFLLLMQTFEQILLDVIDQTKQKKIIYNSVSDIYSFRKVKNVNVNPDW